MKKLLIFTAIVLFGFTNVNSQEEIQIGVKGGVNFSTISSDNFDSFENRTCFNFGIQSEIPLCETFSFGPELLLNCVGAKYSEDFSSFDTTVKSINSDLEGKIKLTYLSIPLMAKFYVSEGFSLEIGPQVSFLLSAKDDYVYFEESEEVDIKEYIKGLDLGANFGLGYKLEGGLNFGARYSLGLTDGNDGYEEGGTYKNSVIQAYVGYFF